MRAISGMQQLPSAAVPSSQSAAAVELPGIANNAKNVKAIKERPELAAFISQVAPHIWAGPKPGQQVQQVQWDVWGHYFVPADARAKDIIVAFAESSAHAKETVLPNGKKIAGEIVFIGRPGDHDTRTVPCSHGVGSEDITPISFTVAGTPGEKVKIRYARLNLQLDGTPANNSGWPDDFGGMYIGRQWGFMMAPNQLETVRCPEDNDGAYKGTLKAFGFASAKHY